MFKELKREKLKHNLFIHPGDKLEMRYVGEAGGKIYENVKLCEYTMPKNMKPRVVTHVIIFEVADFNGIESGIGGIFAEVNG